MTARADDLRVQTKEVVVKLVTSLAAAVAVAVLVAAAPAGATRTHYSSATTSVSWYFQDGCYQRSAHVDAWESSVRQRADVNDAAQLGVRIYEWDSCTGSTLASWQGYVAPAPGELELGDDLQSGAVRASVPVVDDVTGASSVAVVDVHLSALDAAWDTTTASHYRATGLAANWSGQDVGYLADVSGTLLLGDTNVADGAPIAFLAHARFGETLVEALAALARVASGELAGPLEYSQDNVHAVWVDPTPDGCRITETTVAVEDLTDWEGTRTAYAFVQLFYFDVCTTESGGFSATAALDDLEFDRRTFEGARLAGRLDGQLFSGEPISVSVDVQWAATGTRDMWQLTQRTRGPSGGSTYHLNEFWRGATVSGTVDGVAPAGELASAGLHSADIRVTRG